MIATQLGFLDQNIDQYLRTPLETLEADPIAFQGTTNIPPIVMTMNILGIPITSRATFTPTGPLTGTVSLSPAGVLTIAGGTSANLTLVSTSIGPLAIPIGCHTSKPVALSENESVALGQLTSASLSTSGTTTFPSLTGCGIIGPLLSLLFSGPGNPYTLTTTPPASIPF